MSNYSPLPEELRAPKPATETTRKANATFREKLDFSDSRSFENAKRGFIATLDEVIIAHDRSSRPAYDLEALSFIDEGEAPDTVNPSLWRQAQLNAHHHGLYEVVDGVYQVRSFDMSNMSLIRGETGWILIDPLTSAETARAALEIANEQLGERPLSAIIITHSHVDHFGGIMGVISEEEIAAGNIPIIAPLDFVDEALNENVLAGNVMNRRATYMYGNLLKPSATGFVNNGLGAVLPLGSVGFAVPNDIIDTTGDKRVIDGVEIEFQMTMGTEAPSEMVFYFPEYKALCMSEITSHHLHNVYTPRGAQVRDSLAWADQINESIELFGDRLEVQFASHHWPIWGREEVVDYLEKQRDLYKFIHDQALRLANLGYNKEEIAEQMKLPESLGKEFYNRDYYGTLYANARAVYVKYLGFFDGNPSTLHPLPPTDVAAHYVEYMGGADAIVEKARGDFDKGNYRWVAETLNHVVMNDPEHIEGRALLADTFEQMGYQTESGPWRNFYLCGALELREGLPAGSLYGASPGMLASIPMDNMFRILAVRLNASRAEGTSLSINLNFTDDKATLLSIKNSVLHAFPDRQDDNANATVTISALNFKLLMSGQADAGALVDANELQVKGEARALADLAGLFDQFERRFPIVTPRPDWRGG